MPPAGNFFFVLALYFFRTSLSWLSWLCLLSLLYNTHKTQTSMPSAGFEPAIPAGDRLQTLDLDRSATVIGAFNFCDPKSTATRLLRHRAECFRIVELQKLKHPNFEATQPTASKLFCCWNSSDVAYVFRWHVHQASGTGSGRKLVVLSWPFSQLQR